jgi:hypothetical protein
MPGVTVFCGYILSMAPPGAVGYAAVYSADEDGVLIRRCRGVRNAMLET